MSRWLVLFLLALLLVMVPVSIQPAAAISPKGNPTFDPCSDSVLAAFHGWFDNVCSAKYEQQFEPNLGALQALLNTAGAPSFGTDIRMSNANFNTEQNEFQIVINPTDKTNAIGASNDYQTAGVGIYVTTDGGHTWSAKDAPISTAACCDPGVTFDYLGNAYVIVLDTSPSVTYVLRSTDKGTTWTKVASPATADRPNITADNGPTSPRKGRLYLTFSELNVSNRIQGYYSDDKGATWTGPFMVGAPAPSQGYEQSSQPRVGPDGTLWVGYQQYTNSALGCSAGVQNVIAKSTDGGATFTYSTFDIKQGGVCLSSQAGRGVFAIDTSGNYFRSRSHPIMVTHPTKPNLVGFIYSGGDLESTYSCCGGTGYHSDILFRGSKDGGNTWSKAIKINKDPQGKDQYYPWVDMMANGNIVVGWHDRRDDPNDFKHMWYMAASTDGVNWREKVVADVQSQPYSFIGDYAGLAAVNGLVLPMWWDSRIKAAGDPFTDIGP